MIFMPTNEEAEGIFRSMLADFKGIKDTRGLILVLHLYVEWWLNELIKKYFKNSDVILDENPLNNLKSFYNKLMLLNSIGILEGDVFEDIKTVNRIRNIFAHNLDLSHPDVREKFKSEMERVRMREAREAKMSAEDRFSLLAISLTLELHNVFASPPEH